MPGTLHVVATPIGNLEDITFRAVRVLRDVTVIAAEDTRRTAKLLARYDIHTPTISYHEHNWRARTPQLLRRLRDGTDVALVSDAGTPAISDPGAELVRACVDEGLAVDPVPGVSAPLAAAVASGFPLIPLSIYGFTPARSKDRIAWLSRVKSVEHAFCFFESPLRIAAALEDMAAILVERPICVAREVTKVHQQFLRGPAASVRARLTSTKGEFTVVVGPLHIDDHQEIWATDQEVAAEFARLADSGPGSRREAINMLAKARNMSSRAVYEAIERAKK
jgi:16S rRNA (cytidine1402-2'-O)-methyltransferase